MNRAELDRVLNQVCREPASLGGDSDRELLRRFTARGDRQAFATVVHRHGRLVAAACRHVLGDAPEADDAFQATFLILLRQAKRVNWSESLASWLYVVAHRVAVRARGQAKTRRTKEALATPKAGAEPDLSWREACEILHEELDKLPRHYRAALLLCYLEGQSRDEAARSLGCTLDAVKGNLERGRHLLAKRLTRRGITLSAGLLTTAATKDSNAAALDTVVEATVRAVSGSVSPSVALLVAGIATSSRLGRRLIVGTILLCGVLGAAPILGLPRDPEDKPAPPTNTETPTPKAGPTKAGPPVEAMKKHHDIESTVAGQVVDPDGKPIVGGKVYWLEDAQPKEKPTPIATTGGDGRFSFRVRHPYNEHRPLKEQTPTDYGYAFVQADDYGIGWAMVVTAAGMANQQIIVTPDIIPVRGHLIGLEGQPIAGAKVSVESIRAALDGKDLTPWLKWTRDPKEYLPEKWLSWVYLEHEESLRRGGLLPSAITDKNGNFELRGIGRDRVVRVIIEGEYIETNAIYVVTQNVRRFTLRDGFYAGEYYGPQCDLVAAPSAPIGGLVKDADTGKPIPGARIKFDGFPSKAVPGNPEFVSDKNGRYRITGCPAREPPSFAQLKVEGPSDSGYPPRRFMVTSSTTATQPVTADVELKRGVLLTVRVIDKRTKEPVPAKCEYLPLEDNKLLDAFLDSDFSETSYGTNGTCRLVAAPGRGAVAVSAMAERFLRGIVPPSLADCKNRHGGGKVTSGAKFGTFGTGLHEFDVDYHHSYGEVRIDPGAEAAEITVELDPGLSVPGMVVDREGKEVTGCVFLGLEGPAGQTQYFSRIPAPSARFEVTALRPNQKRRVIAFHEDRKLAGSIVVEGGQKERAIIRLEPYGEVKGRLVDESGRPIKDGRKYVAGGNACYEDLSEGASPLCWPSTIYDLESDGKFQFTGLVPGLTHRFHLYREVEGKEGPKVSITPVVKPSEVKDLGDIVVKPPAPPPAKKDDD